MYKDCGSAALIHVLRKCSSFFRDIILWIQLKCKAQSRKQVETTWIAWLSHNIAASTMLLWNMTHYCGLSINMLK